MSKKEVIVPADDLVCLGKDKLQELIRCKDCVYYRQYADGRYDCDNLYGIADAHEDCFCSRAERKEE